MSMFTSLSSSARVKNSYQSLYYGALSNDPKADEVLREKLQKSFADHDVTFSDKPSPEVLRSVMLDAYVQASNELNGTAIQPADLDQLTKDFDSFVTQHPNFHDVTNGMYEAKYRGETLDFTADCERDIRAANERDATREEASMQEMEHEHTANFSYGHEALEFPPPRAAVRYEASEDADIGRSQGVIQSEEEAEDEGPSL